MSGDIQSTLTLVCTAICGLATGATAIGGFLFKRGQTEADYVKRAELPTDLIRRGELNDMRREMENNYARRSETRQAIDTVSALMNQRIDNLEERIDDVKEEVTRSTNKIIDHLTAAAAK